MTAEALSDAAEGGLTPEEIADAVWDETADEHAEDGTMGELVNKLDNLTLARPKVIPGD
jgi:hypothetical protein